MYQLLEQINEKSSKKRIILARINKIDLISKDKLLKKTQEINEKYEFDKIFMISKSIKNDSSDDLLNWFTKHLPQKSGHIHHIYFY